MTAVEYDLDFQVLSCDLFFLKGFGLRKTSITFTNFNHFIKQSANR